MFNIIAELTGFVNTPSRMQVNQQIKIRQVEQKDFAELYALGENTPELKVSATEDFMDKDEFRFSMTDAKSVFLVAEVEGSLAGFIYAGMQDAERPLPNKWACLVYLVVAPKFRRRGIASELYTHCLAELKKRNITNLYCWASAESDGAIGQFMKKQGFAEGHQYMWMDRKI